MTIVNTKMLLVCAFILFFGSSQASQCTAVGRFPNDGESMFDCRGFSICIEGAGGVIFQHDGLCPINFIYNHKDQECTNVTTYQCNSDYKCHDSGKFVNHGSECLTYVECVKGFTNTITARTIACPTDTIFNIFAGDCVDASKYECSHGFRTSVQYVVLFSMLSLFTL